MAFFISYPLSAREPIDSRDDIWMRADKGYDMKNDMLWYVLYNYSMLMRSIHDFIALTNNNNIDLRTKSEVNIVL
jgi:hypothetical protein